jgi:hypothetical protein
MLTWNPPPAEHLAEQNTMGTFPSDAVRGQLSDREEDQNAFTPVPEGFFDHFWTHATVPYGIWGRPPGGRRTSIPYRRVAEAFGSERNIDCFYLLDAHLNGVKSQVRSPHCAGCFMRLTRNRFGDGAETNYFQTS